MRIKRSIVSSIVVIVVATTSIHSASAEDSPKLSYQNPAEITITTHIKSRNLDPSLDKTKPRCKDSKIIGTLKEKYNNASSIDPITVEISLNFDATEEVFEKKLNDLKLDYIKSKHQTYEVTVLKNQMELFENMDDVMLISDPDDISTLAEDTVVGDNPLKIPQRLLLTFMSAKITLLIKCV